MTSVPKPLKFLRPFYEELGKLRDTWSEDLKEQRVRFHYNEVPLLVLAMECTGCAQGDGDRAKRAIGYRKDAKSEECMC